MTPGGGRRWWGGMSWVLGRVEGLHPTHRFAMNGAPEVWGWERWRFWGGWLCGVGDLGVFDVMDITLNGGICA
jgi:hypothetical protein